jgi:TolA-binding protein
MAAFGTAACNRPAEETREEATEIDQQVDRQQNEVAELEQRTNELERDWNAAQERLSKRTDAAATEAKAEIQEMIADVKREVAELRSTSADNWWDRTEQDIESAAGEVEQDVKRFARRWTPDVDNDNVGTTGNADTWEARRDRLVNRMQARIDSMEQALRDVGPDADKEDVEETRAEIRDMREENDRLRGADENDWWDVTRERVNNFIERIDARIDRLINDNT